MRLLHVSASLLLLSAANGCNGCGEETAVPFKRGSFESNQNGKDAGAAQGVAAVTGVPGRAGASYPPDTRKVVIDGAQVVLPEGAEVGGGLRAGLEVDVDADGSLDALLVIEDAEHAPTLALARRGQRGFEAPALVAPLRVGAEACTLASATLEALDASFAVARAELTCGGQGTPVGAGASAPKAPKAPSPPAPPAPGPAPNAATAPPAPAPTPGSEAAAPGPRSLRGLWIIALGTSPSVIEEIVLPAAGDQEGPQLEVALRAAELDGDGHTDLVLGVVVTPPGLEAVGVDVSLWNRAGGLARDGGEPERTLLALADQAKGARKHKPDAAAVLSRRVLAAHGALCRESGHARLSLSGSAGFSCGPSLAAGRAASVLLAALATRGDLLGALAQSDLLRSPAFKLVDNDRERVSAALDARVERSGWRWLEGPRVEVAASAARLSALAFVDEEHVLVRGTPPRSVALASMSAEPIGVMGSTVISDPSARFAVAGVLRSCEGLHLRIVHLAQIVEGVVSGPSVSEPLIAHRAPPAGATCPNLTSEQRTEVEGLRPLSWTAQGVLLVSPAGTLSLLALDDAAKAAQPAHELAAGAAPPKTTYASEWTPDGRFLALHTSVGVALLERGSGRTRLLAPPGDARAITDVAVSPSGRAVAVVLAGRLLVGMPDTGALPPAPATPTTPTAPATPAAPTPTPAAPAPPTPAPPPSPSAPRNPAPALSPPNPPAPAATPAR